MVRARSRARSSAASIIGLLNAFGGAYFPAVADYMVYLALIVILLARPSGLLGRKHDTRTGENLEKASTAKGGDSPFAAAAATGLKRPGWQALAYRFVPYVFALAVLLLLPQFVSTYYQDMLTKVLIFAIFAMSLDLVMGFTGLISFGWAAFFGISGYSVGILTTHYGMTSFWLVLVVSLVVTAGLAAGIGYLSLRVSGVYFLLVTMAFAQLLVIVATKWYSMTGGRDGMYGIPEPQLGFMEVDWTNLNFYYFALIFFIVCYVILHRITHSSFGRSLLGVRANEPRMRSLGYNTWALKYVALIIGGVFAGVAGALFAFDYQTMTPDYFALEISALPMLMVIMGGAATLWGPSLGAAAIVIGESVAAVYFDDRWPLVLGIIFVVCVMFLKGGFARHLTRLWNLSGAAPALEPRTTARRPQPPSARRWRHEWRPPGRPRRQALRRRQGAARRELRAGEGREARPDRAQRRRQVARCSTSSAASSRPPAARSCSRAGRSPTSPPTSGCTWAWAARTR